jgi:hypothetical protein
MVKYEHIIRLIEEARAAATGAGPDARMLLRSLDEALLQARALVSQKGHPDEGTRPEELSSANDG